MKKADALLTDEARPINMQVGTRPTVRTPKRVVSQQNSVRQDALLEAVPTRPVGVVKPVGN